MAQRRAIVLELSVHDVEYRSSDVFGAGVYFDEGLDVVETNVIEPFHQVIDQALQLCEIEGQTDVVEFRRPYPDFDLIPVTV